MSLIKLTITCHTLLKNKILFRDVSKSHKPEAVQNWVQTVGFKVADMRQPECSIWLILDCEKQALVIVLVKKN